MGTIVSTGSRSIILTIVEKSTSMIFMEKMDKKKNAKEISRAVVRLLLPIKEYVKSITTDNGSEFSDHMYIARKLNTTVYFAAPYASWQKGAIENANKLTRQYIPKNMDFKHLTNKQLKAYQYKLNKRPWEKLQFNAPLRAFANLLK